MYKNYFNIFLRNLKKYPGYALLNILGLTFGIASALIILLFVQDEFTYDHNHSKADNIYRLNCRYFLPNDGGYEDNATIGAPVIPLVVNDYPEAIQSVRFQRRSNRVVEKNDGTKFYETIYFADSNVFNLFDFPFSHGDPATALYEPYKTVVTEATANKYFGRTDVVGEILLFPEDSMELEITGVIRNIPSNTHIKFDFLGSFETLEAQGAFMDSWWGFSTWSYLELRQDVDIDQFTNKIKRISANYILDQEEGSGYRQEYSVTNFKDIHLRSDIRGEMEPNSKESSVYTFMTIGLFLLLIASINFMNLATARSALRAREIGVRKVSGALRGQLIGQFMSEAILTVCISLILSVILIWVGLSYINQFTGKSLSINFIDHPWQIISIIGIGLVVGLLSGSYPSLFLSKFKPSETLKGNFKSSNKGGGLRKTLVVIQFTISIVLVCGTTIVYKQMNFMQNKDLGFEKDQVIVVPTRYTSTAIQDFETLKDLLEQESSINSVSLSSRVPGKEMGNNVVRKGWDDSADWSDMRFITVDHDFISLYNINIIAGRDFDKEMGTDELESFMMNEAGLNRLGWTDPEKALGENLRWQNRRGKLIGVVDDFHFMSANQQIQPFLIVMNADFTPGYMSIKFDAQRSEDIVELVEANYSKVMPGKIFEYEFLDDEFKQQFAADKKFMSIVTFFSILAILVASLGLLGLASFIAQLKFKEIGIRKVLGASSKQLIILLNKEFTFLILIAIVIAIPLSYYLADKWIESFPYKTELNWWIFLFGGLVSLIIAWLTVAFQSFKASRINPVDSIGAE